VGTLAFLQQQASSVAADIDLLTVGITVVAVVFSVAIFVAIAFLSYRYRRGSKVDRSRPPQYNHLIEILWTGIPLLIVMGIFLWATTLYFKVVKVPADAMEIHVVGKQWMWKLQHPSGRWENNTLHVPVGRPVVLTMTSEDVIHSFYVPEFRLKQDVIPGQFTQLWFTPTKTGTFHLFCAEFCGTLHSTMGGSVIVMEPSDYERWLTEGNVQETVSAVGQQLFRRHGCSGCHGANSSVRAPMLEGIYGRPVAVQVAKAGVPLGQTQATTMIADTRYIHDAIVLPEKEVAAGFRPIMPTYKNRLSETEVFQLIAYIKSLSSKRDPETRRQDNSDRLTPEDYEARTGFTPENIRGGAAGRGGRNSGGPNGGVAAPMNERTTR